MLVTMKSLTYPEMSKGFLGKSCHGSVLNKEVPFKMIDDHAILVMKIVSAYGLIMVGRNALSSMVNLYIY